MEKTSTVEFRELSNSVTAAVEVKIKRTAGSIEELTKEAEDDALKQAMELFGKANSYAKLKTMEKAR